MASKKKNVATTSGNLPAVRLGSRVRCTDDGVEGRIVWANAVSVKIKWDDGEQVTWKRDSLATRPIEILGGDGDPSAAPATPAAAEPQSKAEPTAPPESTSEAPATRPAATQPPAAAPAPTATAPAATGPISSTTEPATTEAVDPITKPAAPGLGLANAEPPAAPAATASEAAAKRRPSRSGSARPLRNSRRRSRAPSTPRRKCWPRKAAP
jgi:hypothetical protein